MPSLKQTAIILRLAEQMRDAGSWCGETHLQKGAYVLQDLAGAGIEFDFVLYKHGPFSFDLRDHLTSMRGDGLLELVIQPPPYGPKLVPTETGRGIEAKFPNTLKANKARIDLATTAVGSRGVAELERLATALWVTKREKTDGSIDARMQKLCKLKPHVLEPEARDSIIEIDGLIKQAKKLES